MPAAPEGPSTVATGEAQRNPWKGERDIRPSGAEGPRTRADQSKTYFSSNSTP